MDTLHNDRDIDLPVRVLAEGEVLFNEGMPGDEMYMVKTGKIEVFRIRDGEDIVLGYLTAGELFGEMALVDGSPRMASARASVRTELYIVPEAALARALSQATPFLRSVVRILTRNLRSAENMLTEQMARNAIAKQTRDDDRSIEPGALGRVPAKDGSSSKPKSKTPPDWDPLRAELDAFNNL